MFYVVNQPCQVHPLLGGIRTAEEKGAEILDQWIWPSIHSLHLHSEPSIIMMSASYQLPTGALTFKVIMLDYCLLLYSFNSVCRNRKEQVG